MLQVNDTGGCSVIDFGLSYVSAMAEDKVGRNLAISRKGAECVCVAVCGRQVCRETDIREAKAISGPWGVGGFRGAGGGGCTFERAWDNGPVEGRGGARG